MLRGCDVIVVTKKKFILKMKENRHETFINGCCLAFHGKKKKRKNALYFVYTCNIACFLSYKRSKDYTYQRGRTAMGRSLLKGKKTILDVETCVLSWLGFVCRAITFFHSTNSTYVRIRIMSISPLICVWTVLCVCV